MLVHAIVRSAQGLDTLRACLVGHRSSSYEVTAEANTPPGASERTFALLLTQGVARKGLGNHMTLFQGSMFHVEVAGQTALQFT